LVRSAAVLSVLLVVLPSGGAAQSADTYRERVQRLEQRLERLTAEQERRAEAMPPVELDTLRVGPVRLLTPIPVQSFVTAVAAQLRDSLRTSLAGDTVLLPPVNLLLRPRGPRTAARPGLDRLEVQGVHQWFYREEESRFQQADIPGPVASGLLDVIRLRTRVMLDSTLSLWLENDIAFDSLTVIQAQTAYLELAIKPWRIVRDCYEGRLDRCRDALALGRQSVITWYTADERRHVVETAREWEPRLGEDPRAQQCAVGGDDHACVAVLEAYPHVLREPLSALTRQSLLRIALQSGGTGAFGRLVRSDTLAVLDALATAAAVPADSLIARWHRAILAARPRGTVLTLGGGWTAFVWVVVLGVAAMRSTRWRIR
jgi:hypothetical protein